MSHIIRIVADNGRVLTVDEGIELYRSTQRVHLLYELAFLALSKRIVTQSVNITVILKKNGRPVVNQLGFCLVLQDIIFPTVGNQAFYNSVLKCSFS